MIEVVTVDAASTINLLASIEALYPMLALIHVFLDNEFLTVYAGRALIGAALSIGMGQDAFAANLVVQT
jgi:hypothetical protein